MAATTAVYARIDTELKTNAENILSQLGITPASAIQMLYSQIILNNGMPFESKLPQKKLLSVENLTKDELISELLKGTKSIEDGKVYTLEEVDAELAAEFNI